MQQTLSWKTKLSFGMGAFGKDLVYAIVSTYFMKYLTDIRLVDPMVVAVLFVAARIWDAFNDPFMGMVVDNTRSRWGKFRPWILIGTILNAVVLVLLYLDVDLSAGQYAVYVSVMYVLWGMTYTIMDIPYWSMVPALTDNENERSQISAIPRFFASMAWLVVGSGGLYIVKYFGGDDQVLGFSRFAIAVALVFVVTILLTVFNVKERVIATAGTGEKTSVKGMIRVLSKNDQVLVVLGIALFFNMAYQLSNSFAALAAVGYIAPQNIILVGVCSAIVNIGIGFMLVLVTVILSEAVDYGEFKLGTRNESIVFSTQTFVVKFAGAFSGFIAAASLDPIGFVPNEVQSAGTIAGMRVIMLVLPAVLSILCLVVYKRGYRLTDEYYHHILRVLRGEESRSAQD